MPTAQVILRVGQDIRLSVQDALTQGELQGTVLQIGKRQLMLAFPQYRELPGVMVGANAMLSVWDDFGLHRGRSRMLVVTTKPYPGAIVERPRIFTTQQQRGYFRVATSLAISFTPVAAPPETLASRAVTEDISAGGLKFRTRERLMVGADLHLGVEIPLGDQATSREQVALDGRVVRVASVHIEDEDQYAVSCQFERLRDSERDRLVKLLLDLQRRAR